MESTVGARLVYVLNITGPPRLITVVSRNREPKSRAKLKSCKDDEKIARGKRGTSAALRKRNKMIPSLFSIWFGALRRAKPDGKKRVGWRRFTQGGDLGGLALGYYLAPSRAPEATCSLRLPTSLRTELEPSVAAPGSLDHRANR